MTNGHDHHGHSHQDSHGHHHPHGDGAHGAGHDDHGHVHVMPLSVLFTIFGLLIFFTFTTVIISKFHLGALEVPITMTIATTKAVLVAVYFMHLRYDNPFNAMIFCFSLFFVGLFLGGSLMDVGAYQKDLIPPTPAVQSSTAGTPAPPAGAPASPAQPNPPGAAAK